MKAAPGSRFDGSKGKMRVRKFLIFLERGEAAEIVRVINVRVIGVEPNKTISSRASRLSLTASVVRENDFKLGLLSVATERKTGLERL